jgi:hypothetical protein
MSKTGCIFLLKPTAISSDYLRTSVFFSCRCGGKLLMPDRRWEDARVEFLAAFKARVKVGDHTFPAGALAFVHSSSIRLMTTCRHLKRLDRAIGP